MSELTKYENKEVFCFAKMYVKMVAKLIFERAVMLGSCTGSPVFIKSVKFIKILCDCDSTVMYRDIRSLIVIVM